MTAPDTAGPEAGAAARPLDGLKVVEFQSIAPAPLASMMLADFGADVVLVERPGGKHAGMQVRDVPILSRGKSSLALNLKDEQDADTAFRLATAADVVIEGFRPGVLENLGLGPDRLRAANPALIVARVSGWGQTGPYAQRGGHDINYIAIGGPLGQVGGEEPTVPSMFVGDFGGGSLMTVIGILLALQARARTGRGQVVDAAIAEGAAHLMSGHLELFNRDLLRPRGENVMEGGAPYYGTYRCADDRWFAVGALERPFYANLLAGLGITDEPLDAQDDRARWPALRARVARIFLTRTRDEWTTRLAGIEACATPVLDIGELAEDPHHRARGMIDTAGGAFALRPAPLLSETPGIAGPPLHRYGENTGTILKRWAVDAADQPADRRR